MKQLNSFLHSVNQNRTVNPKGKRKSTAVNQKTIQMLNKLLFVYLELIF